MSVSPASVLKRRAQGRAIRKPADIYSLNIFLHPAARWGVTLQGEVLAEGRNSFLGSFWHLSDQGLIVILVVELIAGWFGTAQVRVCSLISEGSYQDCRRSEALCAMDFPAHWREGAAQAKEGFGEHQPVTAAHLPPRVFAA
jgi:hypothetical protein